MNTLLRGVIIALVAVAVNQAVAQQPAPQDAPQKETYYVVRLTMLDQSAICQILSKADLDEMQAKLKNESMVINKAYQDVSSEWSARNKGSRFPLSGRPSARSLRILGQFGDREEANSAMIKETQKITEAQAKLDAAEKTRMDRMSESGRKRQEEKGKETKGVLTRLQQKIDELTWDPSVPPDPAWYPRTLAEIKGVLKTLELPNNYPDQQAVFLQRLKAYRFISGVPYEDLSWSNELEEFVRYTVKAFTMNNQATHGPPKPIQMSDEDFKKALRGAGGNLYTDLTHPRACVDGWMYDSEYGPYNAVGHRRWCLNPPMLKTAFAAQGRFAVMQFDSSNRNVPDWDYVAFPARGYMPMELNYMGGATAWSCSLNMRKFKMPDKDQVKVTVVDVNEKREATSQPHPLNCLTVDNQGFGSGPAIVFRPGGFGGLGFVIRHNARAMVTIDGLMNHANQPAQIQYLVHFVDLSKVPETAESKRIVEAALRKRLDNIKAIPNPFEKCEALTRFINADLTGSLTPAMAQECRAGINELLKDPVVRRERQAATAYQAAAEIEQKGVKSPNKSLKRSSLRSATSAYRDIAYRFKDTDAGNKAAADYERLNQDRLALQ